MQNWLQLPCYYIPTPATLSFLVYISMRQCRSQFMWPLLASNCSEHSIQDVPAGAQAVYHPCFKQPCKLTQISRACHYTTLNGSETTQDRHMLLTPGTLCELGNAPWSACRGRSTSHCCYCYCYMVTIDRPLIQSDMWPIQLCHHQWPWSAFKVI